MSEPGGEQNQQRNENEQNQQRDESEQTPRRHARNEPHHRPALDRHDRSMGHRPGRTITLQSIPVQSSRSLERKASNEDLASLCTLKGELSDYLVNRESEDYCESYPGTERADYDFTLERHHIHSTNFLESVSHLIKGCLGAGIMSIHEGYMYGGLWASLGVTCVIGLIIPYAMYMLVKSAQKLYVRLRVPRLSYPDLVEAAVATGPLKFCRKFSKAFRYSIDTCLFIELCGTCCIYQIMIAQTLKQILEAVSTAAKHSNLSIRVYILVVFLPLFFLCMIRNLKYLAPFSLLADLFIAICVLTTMYYSISHAADVSERPAYKSFSGLMHFCGVLLYSIDGVGITLPVENNMLKPHHFVYVLQIGWTIVLLAVTMTGFFGYLGWGESCQSPITMHMPLETVTILLQFLMCGVLTVTFAVNFWVPFRIIWHYAGKRFRSKRNCWERLHRGTLVMLVTSLAVAYPNLIRIMIFLGNFLLAFIAFIFPAFIESLVFWGEPRKGKIRWRLVKNIIIAAIGVMLATSVFYP